MIKLRLHGESADIEDMIEFLCNNPRIRVLSVSRPYKDRGASVYERCYMDVDLNRLADVAEEVKPKQLKGVEVK